jgi:pSer/pThr/pTyr-binding forkhead associated (FHA) protein
MRPQKPHANAWLVTRDGKNYQLCQGETTIGRRSTNDIMLDEETVSREQAKIVEQNGRFRLYHLSTTTITKINGIIVRQPTLLDPDDEIQFGERVILRFVTAR